jgi:hypothetical protein
MPAQWPWPCRPGRQRCRGGCRRCRGWRSVRSCGRPVRPAGWARLPPAAPGQSRRCRAGGIRWWPPGAGELQQGAQVGQAALHAGGCRAGWLSAGGGFRTGGCRAGWHGKTDAKTRQGIALQAFGEGGDGGLKRMVGVAGEGLGAGVVGSVVGADHQHHIGGLQESEAMGPAEPVAGRPTGAIRRAPPARPPGQPAQRL